MLLGQHLMGEVQIILVDKTSIKALPLLIETVVTLIRVRKDLVLKVLFHNTKGLVLILDFNCIPSYKPENWPSGMK